MQFDIVKEINIKINRLDEKKASLKSNYEKFSDKQKKLSNE